MVQHLVSRPEALNSHYSATLKKTCKIDKKTVGRQLYFEYCKLEESFRFCKKMFESYSVKNKLLWILKKCWAVYLTPTDCKASHQMISLLL